MKLARDARYELAMIKGRTDAVHIGIRGIDFLAAENVRRLLIASLVHVHIHTVEAE